MIAEDEKGLENLEKLLESEEETITGKEAAEMTALTAPAIAAADVGLETVFETANQYGAGIALLAAGAVASVAASGSLDGALNGYRKGLTNIYRRADPRNWKKAFEEGYEKGQLKAELKHISDVWQQGETDFSEHEMSPISTIEELSIEEADQYLKETESAVLQPSNYAGRKQEPQRTDSEELTSFLEDRKNEYEDDLEINLALEPAGEGADRYTMHLNSPDRGTESIYGVRSSF